MADEMKLHLKRVHFGVAPPGSTLAFSVTPGKGFAVRAALDCNMKVVASWEWVELKDGVTIEEVLLPKGTYTLTLDIVFTDESLLPVEMAFSLDSKIKTRQMSGQKPDIGRALAVVFIQ
jgi:hypothetical protein